MTAPWHEGIVMFTLGCAVVAGLSLIDPDNARWFALAFMGVLFVATAIPRRAQPSAEDGGKLGRERGY